MTTDHRTRVSQLARLNQAVRQAIKLGRYDVAVEASNRALATLTNASPRFENSRIAIRTWTDRGTVLEVDDRLPDALRARMKALELARTLDRFPASELATILGSRLIKSTRQELRRGRQKPGSFAPACCSRLRSAGSPSAG